MANNKFNSDFDDSLSFYLKSIDKTKHLSSKRQKELIVLAQKGDLEARNQLIETNQKFVIQTARKYRNLGVPLHDLVVEGTLGLIESIDRFKSEYNVNFITFSIHWIKKYILDDIKRNNNNYEYDENEISFAKNENDELFESRDIELCGLTTEIESILLDDSFENLERKETQEQFVTKMLSFLDQREKLIIMQNFGLLDEKESTLQEISVSLGISKERVRMIKEKAITKIRANIVGNSIN